ncbi:MAG: molybdopterin-synthase adenylyltransferase MoeB, partial [Xanthomonadales bacterium]|nr:molybdopterin-synthase adenylyltransferase MoeB [Xanthomonadales bacterium]NIX11644.1 molybdopterin-synthase adenylyltransferase MoeB [Xanthomonadales bacterium]
ASRVVLVGLGGLGCAAAQYLAASGVGHLELCDYDTVEETNLARQVLYTSADIGRPKIHAAEKALSRLNPGIGLSCHEDRMDEAGIT